MALIKDNKELDSTIAITFLFIVFLLFAGTLLTAAVKSLQLPDYLFTAFDKIVRLIELVLVYMFTKHQTRPKNDGKEGNG